MGAYSDYIEGLQAGISKIPIAGTFVPASSETAMVIAAQIKGGNFPVPTLEVLADLPYQLLAMGMSVVVMEHERPDSSIHPRSVYYLRQLPPENTTVSEVVDYIIANYWSVESLGNVNDQAEISVQYAPSFEGKRPKFLVSEIEPAAYQAGYPNNETYDGGSGNPADIIWVDDFDPTLNHAWVRQRIGTQPWGIPISLSAGGDYEQNQYIDVIFRWVLKGNPAPARPVQPDNFLELPDQWQATPGNDYATEIITKDLYRSQALKNPYGVLKSNWDIPLLVSSDPDLVRYGNTPGSTDFLNDTVWRGYYTPGLDTYMATRTSGVSTDWTITKIDQESGEFDDFVFLALPISATSGQIIAATPTLPVPIGQAFPNNCQDGPFAVGSSEVLYMSKATKYSDGSLKTKWSLPKRFDGIDSIQAALTVTPGDTFYKSRNASGNLVDAFPSITLAASLYKGVTLLASGITAYKWYRGATQIVFDSGTRKALNLGGLNAFHEVSVDGASLIINPDGVDISQNYKVGITHDSRPLSDYEAAIQLKDATDDGAAFVAGIEAVNGTIFKNQVGLYRFNGRMYKGGELDNTNVVFTWSIKDPAGAALTSGLRDSLGASIGDTDEEATEVYVQGSDIDSYAVLVVTATFGEVVRTHEISLVDVEDSEAPDALYWGTGETDPGNPTDFTPRTLTRAEVLALAIGYTEDATGAWYMILFVNGTWGGEIKLRSESARPNGGISLPIFKNIEEGVDPTPTAPAVPGSGSIIPAGWTATPTEFAGAEDATYTTYCMFLLRTDVDADPTSLTRDNYTPLGTYGVPKRITGIDGENTNPGANGSNGWSPDIAVVPDGERRILYLRDWIGGTGTKPLGSGGTASFIGPLGLTTLALATDFRGPAGSITGLVQRPQYYAFGGNPSSKLSTPNRLIHTSDNKLSLVSVDVVNSYSEPRWFLIRGEVSVREDNNHEVFEATLVRLNNLVSLPVTLDANRMRVDINSSSRGMKIPVQAMELIPAGATRSYYVEIQIIEVGHGYHGNGFIEAIGI